MPMDVLDRLLRPLRRGPVTSRYPAVPPDLPPAARGLPAFDSDRCDGVAACEALCPTGAIRVTAATWVIDAGACIQCAACVRACPTGALATSGRIELAAGSREALVVVHPRGAGS